MGFFDKIKRGLTRTKESLIRNIESVVIGYAEIDDDFLEDLEMVLLSGDIGVRTTDYLMRQIRRGVTEGTIHNTNEVMPFMEKTVKELLKDDTIDQENTHHPEVILVVEGRGQDHDHRQAFRQASQGRQEGPSCSGRYLPCGGF